LKDTFGSTMIFCTQSECSNRAKSIPKNATIRKEYVKCGKVLCYHGKHGSYYYAYWKDPETKKLKKKYTSIPLCQKK
jgi:hypothetical protein